MATPLIQTPFNGEYLQTPMSPLSPFSPNVQEGGGFTSLTPNGHIHFRPMSPYQ